MPEELEVDTDKLHESIREELEKEGGSLLKTIALTTAIMAAFAAVASLKAGATVNEALVLKTEATQLQAQASDQWAFYQAKGIKAAVAEAGSVAWSAAGKPIPTATELTRQRYAKEQVEIAKSAHEKEQERDLRDREAAHLLHRHHGFANCVAFLQVAIALGAVAALTRVRTIWLVSLLVGAAGVILFGIAVLG